MTAMVAHHSQAPQSPIEHRPPHGMRKMTANCNSGSQQSPKLFLLPKSSSASTIETRRYERARQSFRFKGISANVLDQYRMGSFTTPVERRNAVATAVAAADVNVWNRLLTVRAANSADASHRGCSRCNKINRSARRKRERPGNFFETTTTFRPTRRVYRDRSDRRTTAYFSDVLISVIFTSKDKVFPASG